MSRSTASREELQGQEKNMSLVLKQSLIVMWCENDRLPNKLTIFVCILKAVSQKHVALFFFLRQYMVAYFSPHSFPYSFMAISP